MLPLANVGNGCEVTRGRLEDNHSALEPWAAVQIQELISMDGVCHSSPRVGPAAGNRCIALASCSLDISQDSNGGRHVSVGDSRARSGRLLPRFNGFPSKQPWREGLGTKPSGWLCG